ncbi:hypothetical protein NPS70_16490 [Streptomyces sp. C10-9-1]|uniref:hypothetical protein n=1 Tax=Streptomyces sp. C10-9-1 TaxID=1859285 RepID=UPI0021124FA2|nr:hypothetical protein [Streptomyces sp. C10-9-1]MCQ6554785.1 hypothetical protein [Streptomyces sp. C10-9-1]
MAEIIVALIAAIATVGAAYIPLLRRTRGAVEAEGEMTRDAVTSAVRDAVESLGSRLDSRIDDVRDDLDEVRENVSRVREWQAGHDAEHLIIGSHPPRSDP